MASIVYPADIGVLWITALNIQLSVVLYLLALYLLLILAIPRFYGSSALYVELRGSQE